MQRRNLRMKRGSALNVKVGTATSCSPVGISWDASSGKAPWTVMIAPINQTPSIISIPDASGSSATYNWSVPHFTKTTDAFIAVSDSTGAVSGVASQVSIGTSHSTCTSPATSLDFVWYPTSTAALPSQCSDWSISWEKDSSNNGIEGKVTFTFLPENGVPLTVSTSNGKATSNGGTFDFNIPWASGTKFAAIANDGGKSGTGGVGNYIYSVTAGKSTNCAATKSIGNGLPPAQTTGSVNAKSSTKTNSNSDSNTSKGSTSATTGSSSAPEHTQASTAADGTSSTKHSSVGAAVGGTFAALAIIALLLLGVFWYRKKRSSKAENPFEKEGGQQHGISPWRWSSSPYQQPATNSRASKWLDKASSIVPTKGFRVLGDRSGTDMDNSFSTSFKGPFTSAHTRNASSISSPISPQHQSTTTFRNVVPDDALFPPPKPFYNDERNYKQSSPYSEGGKSGQVAGVGTYDSMTKQDSASQYSTSPQDATFAIQKGNYHPMPNMYDASRMLKDQQSPTHEIQLGYSQPSVTNEVMMQTFLRSDQDRQSQHSEEGLPYL